MALCRSREVVVVTGTPGGIGRAIAAEFAKEGAQLGLMTRDADELEGAILKTIRAATNPVENSNEHDCR